MPKNKGKGGKNRRRGKNENDVMKRELIRKDGDDQAYAQVQKMLGNGRLTAQCFDGKERLCHIRGKLRKKVWINTGDIILVGLRGYQESKADVILKYTTDEARILKNEGQLPESARLNEGGDEVNEGEVEFVDFGDELDDDEEGVGVQDRQYEITSSEESSDESESDDNDEGNIAIISKKLEQQKPITQKKRQEVASESSGSESDSESEDEDPELLAERGSYNKPGHRDRYGKATKGKKGK
ncbi:Eukaryotic translation initiation factor 4C [Aphelenchoides besseyi]|nr:Eukaryotic translation initiation factor 4C [Aphelenchoides besseyi]KAI6210829.1 Eukaryotic translation initiation factor 4C [Aphelenchoides besseyi]